MEPEKSGRRSLPGRVSISTHVRNGTGMQRNYVRASNGELDRGAMNRFEDARPL